MESLIESKFSQIEKISKIQQESIIINDMISQLLDENYQTNKDKEVNNIIGTFIKL